MAELRAKLEEKEEMCKNHLEAMESSKAEYNRVGEELKSKVETAEKKLVEVEEGCLFMVSSSKKSKILA